MKKLFLLTLLFPVLINAAQAPGGPRQDVGWQGLQRPSLAESLASLDAMLKAMKQLNANSAPNLVRTFEKRKSEGQFDPTVYIQDFNQASEANDVEGIATQLFNIEKFILRTAKFGNMIKSAQMINEARDAALSNNLTGDEVQRIYNEALASSKAEGRIVR